MTHLEGSNLRRCKSGVCSLPLGLAALLAIWPALLPAQEKTPYQTLGTPTRPKVAAQWNRYHDYAQSTKILQDLAAAHPEVARLKSLGKSYGGREMWVLTVTNFGQGDDAERPAMWIDGGIHANEIQASEVVLYTAWFLCEMRGESADVRRLLDERVFYLMPMMSPDSRDAHFYEPNTTHSPRTGQRPIDDDRDGKVDEDGPDDLDGDGSITMMRIRDPNGRYKSHPDFPQLMVPVKEGEKGEFTLLGPEGKDDDGDGEVNEDGDGSYDPNRDWGWNWAPDYVQRGAYRYPFSIEENRLVADFISAHPNIVGGQSYHNAGGMILRGPGEKSDAFDPSDIRVYDALAARGSKVLPGYRYMNIAHDLYEVWGGEVDWLHQSRGVYAFTNELFTPFNFFRTTGHEGFFGSTEVQHQFDKYLLLGEGFAAWREVDHPQYGKIEVGGMRKNWVRQPPSFLLEEECHRNMAFSLYHADELPLVKIQSVSVEKLAGGVQQITAIVENPKICPTHSAADRKFKITPPDLVTLKGEGLKVIAVLRSGEPLFRQPVDLRRAGATVKLDSIPGRGIEYVRWLVEGAGPWEVELVSVKGGRDRKQVESAP